MFYSCAKFNLYQSKSSKAEGANCITPNYGTKLEVQVQEGLQEGRRVWDCRRGRERECGIAGGGERESVGLQEGEKECGIAGGERECGIAG